MGLQFNPQGSYMSIFKGLMDAVFSAAKGVLCIPSILSALSNPINLLQTAESAISGIVGSLSNVVSNIVQSKISSVLQTASSIFNLGSSELGDIQKTIKSIEDRATDLLKTIADNQNCMANAATMFSCISKSVNNQMNQQTAMLAYNNPTAAVNKITANIITSGTATAFIANQVNSANQVTNQLSL